MQIGIKGIPIVHPLLQCGMASLCLRRFTLRRADPVLSGREFTLQPQRALLSLLRCYLHGTQLRLQLEQGCVEAGDLDMRVARIRNRLCSLQCCTLRGRLRLQGGSLQIGFKLSTCNLLIATCGRRF